LTFLFTHEIIRSVTILVVSCYKKDTAELLTGDNVQAAQAIGAQLGISEIHAGCLPEEKLRYIETFQNCGLEVCMIGDGINDAPSLKKANVGIAMGGVGSDIAVDAADITLVDDEVKELPHLLSLSKRMMTTIRLNLTFSMGLNFLAIVLAITGILNPVVGALVHNAGSVLVIVNSALLLGWRKRT
jgi:P-type E1-E2 ATPase